VSLILDTHIMLWWLGDRSKLAAATRELFADPANRVVVSVASIWEAAIKASLGRLTFSNAIVPLLEADGIEILPILAAHALVVSTLPTLHKDPFDRMLVAQALHEGLTLLTRDPWVLAYPVATFRA
jgi:PIN domain nuclease of toxin-antitoxin system